MNNSIRTNNNNDLKLHQKFFRKFRSFLNSSFRETQMSLAEWEALESKKRVSHSMDVKDIGFKRVQ